MLQVLQKMTKLWLLFTRLQSHYAEQAGLKPTILLALISAGIRGMQHQGLIMI